MEIIKLSGFNRDDWNCESEDILLDSLMSYQEEFQIFLWTQDTIYHFLEIKFHLVRGTPTIKHVKTCCYLLSQVAR